MGRGGRAGNVRQWKSHDSLLTLLTLHWLSTDSLLTLLTLLSLYWLSTDPLLYKIYKSYNNDVQRWGIFWKTLKTKRQGWRKNEGLAWSIFAQTMRQELDQAQTGHSRKIQQTLLGKIYTAVLHTSVFTYNNVYTCVPEQTISPPLHL